MYERKGYVIMKQNHGEINTKLEQTRSDNVIKKEMIAMLLAGGQGSRLGVLTADVAKPAVAFGGKYRIIDSRSAIASIPELIQ